MCINTDAFDKDLMTINVMNISIYGIRKVKTINILNLYKKLNYGKSKTWFDDYDINKNFKNLKIEYFINDNMGVGVHLSFKNDIEFRK